VRDVALGRVGTRPYVNAEAGPRPGVHVVRRTFLCVMRAKLRLGPRGVPPLAGRSRRLRPLAGRAVVSHHWLSWPHRLLPIPRPCYLDVQESLPTALSLAIKACHCPSRAGAQSHQAAIVAAFGAHNEPLALTAFTASTCCPYLP
jgi:hypothetical protein